VSRTLHRAARTVLPTSVRRRAHLILDKRRIVRSYGGIRRSPTQALRYLLFDRELDNFTYPVANTAELADFVADALATDAITVRRYVDELAGDTALADEIGARLAVRRDRNRTMPFGRRLGWYAIARLRRPGLIVETGVHDGLGSTALLRALQRNDAEGYPGTLVSIDRRPSAGWLIPDELRPRHHLVVGDALIEIPRLTAGRRVDMFIHDSDHRYEHETAEFETIADRAGPGAILLSDNSHASTAFADFCARRSLAFRFWKEIPRGHFYPGAGIGLAVVPVAANPAPAVATVVDVSAARI
jgi:hypothetical protein